MAGSSRKKARRQYHARPQSQHIPAPHEAAATAADTSEATRTAEAKASAVSQEYRYVISDLKRIGITAASMFAILVVLALIIT